MTTHETFLDLFEKQKTTILFIVGATAMFFWQVVIPIQKIQAQLAEIQIQLANVNKQFEANDTFHNNIQTRMTVVETKLERNGKPN
jgi:hypothetical protein